MEGTLLIAAAAGRDVELYGNKKGAGEEGEKYLSPGDVYISLEQGYHGLSTRARRNDEPGRRSSISSSKYKSRDERCTDGQAFLSLPDTKVSPMELSYLNDNLEDHEGDGHITRTDGSLEFTDHTSIPTGRMPAKIPPWDQSDSLYDEGTSFDPKSDIEGKELVVDVNQDIVRGSPKFYNSYAQLVQMKQPPHYREEEGTRVASSLTPQSQELLINPSPWCLPLHTVLTLHESIVARLAGLKKNKILRVAQKTA